MPYFWQVLRKIHVQQQLWVTQQWLAVFQVTLTLDSAEVLIVRRYHLSGLSGERKLAFDDVWWVLCEGCGTFSSLTRSSHSLKIGRDAWWSDNNAMFRITC